MRNISWKQIAMLVGLLVVAGIMGVGIYYYFFRPITPDIPIVTTPEQLGDLPIAGPGEIPTTTPTTPVTPGRVAPQIVIQPSRTIPTTADATAQGGITQVTDIDYEDTPAMAVDPSGNGLLTYNNLTGEFSRIDADGQKVALTDKKFPQAQSIAWAPTEEKVIAEFPDGSNIMYDFRQDRQYTLPATWTEFQFNDTGNQIAFKDMDPNMDRRFLAVAAPDGSNQKFIEFMGSEDRSVTVKWSPNNQYVATVNRGATGASSKLYFLGLNGENFQSLEVNGYGVDYEYTADGNTMIYNAYSSYTDNMPHLYTVDVTGDNVGANHQDLGLNTWIDKCTFVGTETVYCAVPRELPKGAGWFRELADNIPDDIYKVDLRTGAKSFVAEPETNVTISQLRVNADESTLFFTDNVTQTLRTIKLR